MSESSTSPALSAAVCRARAEQARVMAKEAADLEFRCRMIAIAFDYEARAENRGVAALTMAAP